MNLQDQQTQGQPEQTQDRQPGIESEMNPLPIYEDDNYIGTGKLKGKVALVTGETAELDELYPLLMRKKERT